MFAVVDVETTGLHPGRSDRIVEVGLVILDERFRQVYEWQTLVNPKRDLGPTGIHGITTGMVLAAPAFGDIAGALQQLLQGANLVAHNAAFDVAFLRSEFKRACCGWPEIEGLCTMTLATYQGLPRSLAGACAATGIRHEGAHSALGDARATAALLAIVGNIYKGQVLEGVWPVHPHELRRSGQVHTRSDDLAVPGSQYLAQLLERMPARPAGSEAALPSAVLNYMGVLDRALEDRVVDAAEAIDLAGIAFLWGLSVDDVTIAHQKYLVDVAAAALADGVVTDDERADLERVAVLLGGLRSDVGAALDVVRNSDQISRRPEDLTGKTVCFTGASTCRHDGRYLDRAEAEALAASVGLLPQKNVTKKLDVLVLADPDTQSAKASKARANGTRVIAERQFWATIGFEVS